MFYKTLTFSAWNSLCSHSCFWRFVANRIKQCHEPHVSFIRQLLNPAPGRREAREFFFLSFFFSFNWELTKSGIFTMIALAARWEVAWSWAPRGEVKQESTKDTIWVWTQVMTLKMESRAKSWFFKVKEPTTLGDLEQQGWGESFRIERLMGWCQHSQRQRTQKEKGAGWWEAVGLDWVNVR